MAAIAFTTGNISPGTTTDATGACSIQRAIAGATITAGMDIVIKASDGLGYPAQATATTMASAGGVALNPALPSQPFNYCDSGPVNFGTTVLSTGQHYILGATAGQIHPAADLTSGWFSSRLGWAYSASVLVVDRKNTGVQN